MGAIKSFLGSEKGLLGLALIIAATVLCVLGQVLPADWLAYTKWIFGFYAGAKAVQGGAAAIATALTPNPTETHAILDKLLSGLATMHAAPHVEPTTTNNSTTVIVPAAATETTTNA